MNSSSQLKESLRKAGIPLSHVKLKNINEDGDVSYYIGTTDYCIGVLEGKKVIDKKLSEKDQVFLAYLKKDLKMLKKMLKEGKTKFPDLKDKTPDDVWKEYEKMSWMQKILFKYF